MSESGANATQIEFPSSDGSSPPAGSGKGGNTSGDGTGPGPTGHATSGGNSGDGSQNGDQTADTPSGVFNGLLAVDTGGDNGHAGLAIDAGATNANGDALVALDAESTGTTGNLLALGDGSDLPGSPIDGQGLLNASVAPANGDALISMDVSGPGDAAHMGLVGVLTGEDGQSTLGSTFADVSADAPLSDVPVADVDVHLNHA